MSHEIAMLLPSAYKRLRVSFFGTSLFLMTSGLSLRYIMYNKGARTEPWGTPACGENGEARL